MYSAVNIITALCTVDCLDPTLIPSQFPNPVLMPLDSLTL